MKTSHSALFLPAIFAFLTSAALLNPNPEKLIAQGFLALVSFFTFAIFHAEQEAAEVRRRFARNPWRSDAR